MTHASPHGWIILDKPLGLSSAGGVAAIKRLLRQAGLPRIKIGHGGTLDPLATGVLPIALGEATKLAGRLLDATKEYEFTVQFGRQTDTLDLEGAVVATSDFQPGFGAVEAVVQQHFLGEIDQIPPAYSALKVDGARAYDLARAGEQFDLASRRVTIGPWRYIAEGFAGEWDQSEQFATLAVTVSKGTYIRSLARDIALALGTVGHVTMLRRTKAGPFSLSQAITLDNLAALVQGAALEQAILPMTTGLDDIPALAVDPNEAAALRQGRILFGHPARPGQYLAVHGTVPVALVEITPSPEGLGEVRVVRGFNL